MPEVEYKHSKETRLKISKTLKKRWSKMSEEEKLNRLKPWYEAGIRAVKEKLVKMTKEEKREHLRPWIEAGLKACRGANQTPEARQNTSKAQRKWWVNASEEERNKHLKPWAEAGAKATKERWAKMTKEERREATELFRRAGRKARHKKIAKLNKEERREYFKHWFETGMIASQKANPSSIEKKIWGELDKLNIEYKTQVPFNGHLFIVDIYIPSKKLIIECNGDYYHNYEIFPKRKIRDEALEKYANRVGLKIIWLWEFEIRKNPKQALLSKITLKEP